MNEKPIERLKKLLNSGRELTLSEIAGELDVSRRHSRRLLNSLRRQDLQVNERWEGGQKHFALDPSSRKAGAEIDLREEELYALTVASYAAQSVLNPTPLENDLRAAVEKLLTEAGPTYSFEPDWQRRVWKFDEGRASDFDSETFLTVVRAANRCETLEIDYYSASSREMTRDRLIDPFAIAEQRDSWLMVGYCHRKRSVLDFALPGIEAVEPTGSFFSRPEHFDLESHFAGRFHALKGEGSHDVVIEVEAAKAPYFDRKAYHPTQAIQETRADGSIVVEFEVSSLDDIAAFIRSWGPGVRVLQPESLSARIAKEAKAVYEAYSS